MYNWKKRLLAAVLAGCMTVGLMAPALATVGGEDTLTTAGEVDPGFSVDPVYPVEPTDPVEPVEPTPPVETEIPDGEIPLDPGFGMHDWANMSTEELYEVVKDLSDEDRAIVYSLLTEVRSPLWKSMRRRWSCRRLTWRQLRLCWMSFPLLILWRVTL